MWGLKSSRQKGCRFIVFVTVAEHFCKAEFFKSMTFKQFLIESGMLKEENEENKEEIQKARSRYLTALRADVRGAGMLILKRNPCDVFTNNYNNKKSHITPKIDR